MVKRRLTLLFLFPLFFAAGVKAQERMERRPPGSGSQVMDG